MTAVLITSSFADLLATKTLTATATDTELTFSAGASEQIDLLLTVDVNTTGLPIITVEVNDDTEGWALYPFGGPESASSKCAPTADGNYAWTIFGLDRKEQSIRIRAADANAVATLAIAGARKSTGIPFTVSV